MIEKTIFRIFWLPFLIAFGYCVYRFNSVNKLTENVCNINSIYYPKSFNSTKGWINCLCEEEFCVGICYCVSLYSNNNLIKYSNKKIHNEKCTFKSITIPYELNFNPILNKYLNKSVPCWKDNEKNLYLNDSSTFKSILALVVFLGFINFIFISIEIWLSV